VVPRDREVADSPPSTSVLVDVTTIVSAEDYLISQNHSTRPEDPFARQSFVELVQSLIFMSKLYVAHPLLHRPVAADFGQQPRLLRSLMRPGLLLPLRLGERERAYADLVEAAALRDLKSPQGTRSVMQFVDQAVLIDTARPGERYSLSGRLNGWSRFQARRVRVAGHHQDRIGTSDGIEDDDFGLWARSVAVALEGTLAAVAPPGEQKYLMAALARGLRYRARADATGLSYQSHPIRRDFGLTFDLNREGAEGGVVLDVIKAVRGIHESLSGAAGHHESHRMRLLELDLPLLGGRLWTASDTGQRSDADWIDWVVARIADYRERARELREAIERCVTDEDYVRLARDLDEVTRQLLERLGLRQVELSATERELVDSVASVVQVAPGVPKVSGIWFGARKLGKQLTFSGQGYQRFLYREFLDAWKRAGR
jgi:hypothetical protein